MAHASKERKIPPMRNRPSNRVVVSTPESYAIRANIGIRAKQHAERATKAYPSTFWESNFIMVACWNRHQFLSRYQEPKPC